jgi:hypothetical protein
MVGFDKNPMPLPGPREDGAAPAHTIVLWDMDPKYEEQFTAFVDFLGFSEVSSRTDDTTRRKILGLLLALSTLRGDFDVQSAVNETNKTITIKPAISTFSDHIVISFPLEPIYKTNLPSRSGQAWISSSSLSG